MSEVGAEVKELLALASHHDGLAREARRTAGRLLAEMRETTPSFLLAERVGLDGRTVQLLLEMAAGGTVRAGGEERTADTLSAHLRRNGTRGGRGMSKHSHLYGTAWKRARAEFLIEHPRCALCAKAGKREWATVVDHVKPHRGDPELFWDRDNWQPLCQAHHDSYKQALERSGKPKPDIGIDGWPIT